MKDYRNDLKTTVDEISATREQYKAFFNSYNFRQTDLSETNTIITYFEQKKENPAPPQYKITTYEQYKRIGEKALAEINSARTVFESSDYITLKSICDLADTMERLHITDSVAPVLSPKALAICRVAAKNIDTVEEYTPETLKAMVRVYKRDILVNNLKNFSDAELTALSKDISREDIVKLYKSEELVPENVRTFLHIELPKKNLFKDVKVVGTTFSTDDGTSRQELLASLSKSQEKEITILPYIYTPAVTDNNPDAPAMEYALAVLWQGKDIANLSRDFAKKVFEDFEKPQFKASVHSVYGGNGKNYGMSLDIEIIGKKRETPLTNQDAELMQNPLNI